LLRKLTSINLPKSGASPANNLHSARYCFGASFLPLPKLLFRNVRFVFRFGRIAFSRESPTQWWDSSGADYLRLIQLLPAVDCGRLHPAKFAFCATVFGER